VNTSDFPQSEVASTIPRYPIRDTMNTLRYYPILALGAVAAIVGYALLSRKPKRSTDLMEYERRTELTRGGRIIDGTVIDVYEVDESPDQRQMILLIYTYDVAGVTYEASQDVTHLRQFIDLYSCRLGLPASVKYDPHNPGDSIVISEKWSGLRPFKVLPRFRPVAS
jgi:hypothetical protein